MKNSALHKLTPEATVAQITNANEQAGKMLESIGLHPSDQQKQSLRSVCQQEKLSEMEVLGWLKDHLVQNGSSSQEQKSVSLESIDSIRELCSYLEKRFHSSNKNLVSEIEDHFPRVHKIHGNQYPWLKNLKPLLAKLTDALRMYYKFEEQKLHKVAQKVEETRASKMRHGIIQSLAQSRDIVEQDQERIGRIMKEMNLESNNFENPENACSTLRILNQNIKKLFEEVKQQFKLEQELLLPMIGERLGNRAE